MWTACAGSFGIFTYLPWLKKDIVTSPQRHTEEKCKWSEEKGKRSAVRHWGAEKVWLWRLRSNSTAQFAAIPWPESRLIQETIQCGIWDYIIHIMIHIVYIIVISPAYCRIVKVSKTVAAAVVSKISCHQIFDAMFSGKLCKLLLTIAT